MHWTLDVDQMDLAPVVAWPHVVAWPISPASIRRVLPLAVPIHCQRLGHNLLVQLRQNVYCSPQIHYVG